MNKVVFIIVDNLYSGGAGRVASILANHMLRRHKVFVFVKEPGINYQISPQLHYEVLNDNAIYRPFKIVKRVCHLSCLIRKYKPDVIYSLGFMSKYSVFAKIISRHKHIKLVASERQDPNSEPRTTFMKRVRNYCYNKSDVLVCQTYLAAEYYRNKIKTPLIVIPNPITPNLPSWAGIESKKIVTACRLAEQKNLPLLLKAFRKFADHYPDYTLEIYGEGHLKQYLQDMVKSLLLDNKVKLMGASNNIHQIISESFMFVLSSDYEGMSNSMIEALGIGIPTICTDCPIGGASMLVKNKVNGLLVPVGDVDSLYEAMLWIIANMQQLPEMSKEASLIRERLDENKIVVQWESLMN